MIYNKFIVLLIEIHKNKVFNHLKNINSLVREKILNSF